MSYFSTALQRHAEDRHLNQTDIGRRCGLSRSFISRVMNGESRDLSDQNLAALFKLFPEPHAQAELIAARCMDAREVARAAGAPGADLVQIQISSASKSQDAKAREVELPQVHLSSETEKAFIWLRSQCPLNPDLEKHLVGYARLTGMK